MKYTNTHQLPSALVRAVKNDIYDPGHGDISTTQLIKPPQAVEISRQNQERLEMDVSDAIPSLFGTAMHTVLERGVGQGCIVEERFYMPVTTHLATWQLSGQIDMYENHTLFDYKVCSTWKKILGSGPEWEAQMNVNAALMQHNGHQIDRLQICAIYRDWSRTEAERKKEDGYPQAWGEVIHIPIWSQQQMDEYIHQRVELHQQARLNQVYAPCTDEETWARDEKWAVKKEGNQKATKLFDNPQEAQLFRAEKGNQYLVEHRPPKRPMCEHYCSAAPFCPQKQKNDIEAGYNL